MMHLTGALALLLLLAPAAHAGWVVLDESGDQTLISRGRLKLAPQKAAGHSMVIDVGQARMWIADAGRRVYWEGTVEEYCEAMRGTMAEIDKQMAEAMKNMPPAQREQMQQMMRQMGRGGGAGPAPTVTIERTGDTETIAGLPTRKYRVLADGKLHQELWLTTDTALLRELELGRASDTFGRMFGCMAGMGGGERVETSAEYRGIYAQGWPLKAIHHAEGKGGARSTVARVEQRDIPDREFAAPAGFRAVPLSEIFGTERPRR
jgi:hypothetical protein